MSNPAPAGSVVALWATETVLLSGAYADGSVAPVSGNLATVAQLSAVQESQGTLGLQYAGQAICGAGSRGR